MPVKPYYHRSPMSALRAAPLGPGQARMNYRFLSEMYQAAYVYQSDFAMWEGLFRLACIIHDHPLDEPICGQIYEKIHQQGAEGDFAGDPVGNLQIARAALALYEYANSRDILKSVLLCCSWISVHWEEVVSNNSIRRNPADLMEFLVKVYWYTGKKPILSLCDKLRREAVNWTGLLQTYSIKRPTSMMASWLEMRAGIDREADADEGQYVRQYMLTHAETLADGLRATSMNAIYSGSGDEAQAAKNGWGRISHWHGAVCGGTTADESVQGNDPSIAIDGASVCAWGEAFLVQFLQDDASWAIDEFDTLLHNAIPATIVAGRLTPYQRVNMVEKTPLIRECYHTHPSDEQRKRVLVRLCRVAARAASSVVMTTPHGADVILYVSGEYDFQMNEKAFRASIKRLSDTSMQILLQGKEETESVIRLHIPEWMKGVQLAVNGKSQKADVENGFVALRMVWHHGDLISLIWEPNVRTVETFHQGRAVFMDNILMALDVSDRDWKVALVGEPYLEDGRVHVSLGAVNNWEQANGVTKPLPVQPKVTGKLEDAVLVPYISSPVRMSVFPRGVV